MFNAFRTSLVAKRAELAKDDKGFTLIELLVVILIIGILTAIAVPVFIGQQNQAKDAAAKSDLGVAKVALISFYTANPSGTPTAANLAPFGYVRSAGVGALDLSGVTSSTSFCIDVASETGTTFNITGTTPVAEGACA